MTSFSSTVLIGKSIFHHFFENQKLIITTGTCLQRDSNPQPLSSQTNTQPCGQTGQMIELCCEYLSVRCI